jgi:hypothetical protein
VKHTTEAIRKALKEHWLTSIQCDHESRTDRAGCFCGTWYCEPQPSIGEAVDKWIEHLIDSLPREVRLAPLTSEEVAYLEDLRGRSIASASPLTRPEHS